VLISILMAVNKKLEHKETRGIYLYLDLNEAECCSLAVLLINRDFLRRI
jgi:hypothetical protein